MPAHEDKPDLGFEGEWADEYYFCRPVKGWGAVLYVLLGDIHIHFFPSLNLNKKDSLRIEYVSNVLHTCKGDTPRTPHYNDVPDWLTAVCLLHKFAEEHTDGTPTTE